MHRQAADSSQKISRNTHIFFHFCFRNSISFSWFSNTLYSAAKVDNSKNRRSLPVIASQDIPLRLFVSVGRSIWRSIDRGIGFFLLFFFLSLYVMKIT